MFNSAGAYRSPCFLGFVNVDGQRNKSKFNVYCFNLQVLDSEYILNSNIPTKCQSANILLPKTKTMSFPSALPPPNAPSMPQTNKNPRFPWRRPNSQPADRKIQGSNPQAEKIIAEVYAEFVKLHSIDYNLRIELQMRNDVQARLETQIRHQSRRLQEAEKQAFDLRERIRILEVELSCQKQEHLQ